MLEFYHQRMHIHCYKITTSKISTLPLCQNRSRSNPMEDKIKIVTAMIFHYFDHQRTHIHLQNNHLQKTVAVLLPNYDFQQGKNKEVKEKKYLFVAIK